LHLYTISLSPCLSSHSSSYFLSSLSLSPLYLPPSLTHSRCRFGIEGTILLEPIAAMLNNRPQAAEGTVSSAVKYDLASHTVTIYEVRYYILRHLFICHAADKRWKYLRWSEDKTE
jgi:hypothetical protein